MPGRPSSFVSLLSPSALRAITEAAVGTAVLARTAATMLRQAPTVAEGTVRPRVAVTEVCIVHRPVAGTTLPREADIVPRRAAVGTLTAGAVDTPTAGAVDTYPVVVAATQGEAEAILAEGTEGGKSRRRRTVDRRGDRYYTPSLAGSPRRLQLECRMTRNRVNES